MSANTSGAVTVGHIMSKSFVRKVMACPFHQARHHPDASAEHSTGEPYCPAHRRPEGETAESAAPFPAIGVRPQSHSPGVAELSALPPCRPTRYANRAPLP